MSFEAGVILAVPITAFLMYIIKDWLDDKIFNDLPDSLQYVVFWVKHFFKIMIIMMLPTTFTTINILAGECGYGTKFDWLVGSSWLLFFTFFTFYTYTMIIYFITFIRKGGSKK